MSDEPDTVIPGPACDLRGARRDEEGAPLPGLTKAEVLAEKAALLAAALAGM